MDLDIRPYAPADRESLRALLADPSVAPHFDKFQGPSGLEHKLSDPRLPERGILLASVGGEPAGFALSWTISAHAVPWFMMRVGVPGRFRRRGIGRRLVEALLAYANVERAGNRADVAASAWMPNKAGEALAARFGFAHERWFWLMERPRGGVPDPVWPEKVERRLFDHGESMLNDWTQAYNDSFAHHFRHVPASIDYARQLAADPTFRADGLALAYRDGVCIGFCRNELHAMRGEVGTLGVVQSARGIGLGRALLRWGVRWIETETSAPVTLLVDGENEGALSLYRAEGFAISRTRRIWGRVLEAGS